MLTDAEGAEQELSTKLSSAIHSIDEAIVDMLNAASLLRTVRWAVFSCHLSCPLIRLQFGRPSRVHCED